MVSGINVSPVVSSIVGVVELSSTEGSGIFVDGAVISGKVGTVMGCVVSVCLVVLLGVSLLHAHKQIVRTRTKIKIVNFFIIYSFVRLILPYCMHITRKYSLKWLELMFFVKYPLIFFSSCCIIKKNF